MPFHLRQNAAVHWRGWGIYWEVWNILWRGWGGGGCSEGCRARWSQRSNYAAFFRPRSSSHRPLGGFFLGGRGFIVCTSTIKVKTALSSRPKASQRPPSCLPGLHRPASFFSPEGGGGRPPRAVPNGRSCSQWDRPPQDLAPPDALRCCCPPLSWWFSLLLLFF